jgi:pimeloyl-ACP methyl ester carboxylesterase
MPHIPAGDLNIYYLEKGEGTPVVFVHGNWTTSTEWEPVLERLPAGYRGLAPDVRGRGRTEGPDNTYTMPELAADLRAFVDALGLDTFHLVSHSLGSAIALQFALESPERLRTLTVLAPGWVDGMPAAYNVPAAQQALYDDPALFAQALKFQMPTLPDGDLWQRLVTEGHQQRPSATLANLPALLNWQPGAALRAIPVPVLVASGAQDVLTGGANAERAADVLNTQAVVIEGVGHSPNIEAPDQFVALLMAHIEGTERPTTVHPPSAAPEAQQGGAMADQPLLPGMMAAQIKTPRLTMNVLSSGPADGEPVVFIHGNVSSAIFWEETMLALPPQYRGLAPDLRGYGGTEAVPIDATRGLRDWADDLHALFETLALRPFHLVGWSMGAGVAMQYTLDHPATVRSLTLMSPLSPYGFGATKDVAGTLTYADAAGSGGGTVNPDFLQRLKDGDRSEDSPTSPRTTMNTFYFKPPFRAAPDREEAFVTAMLSTRTGDGFYPGDLTPSANWPGVAPGTQGINNAMAPHYCNLSAFATLAAPPPVLWVRGADDQIVSDTSFFDLGFLGQLGAVPGWPGATVFPPQPMVSQMRAVLDQYQANGGHYWEKVIPDCGHSPHVEKPAEFRAMLLEHLRFAASD